MRASNADSHRKNFVLSSSSPLKTFDFAWGKRWSWVTLAKASVIGDGKTYTGLAARAAIEAERKVEGFHKGFGE